MHDVGVSDHQPAPDVPCVFDRLVAAGLSIERVEQHLAAGRVHVDGETVTDPSPPPRPRARESINCSRAAGWSQSICGLPSVA